MTPVVVPITSELQIAQARQTAGAVAESLNFSRVEICCISTSVSEMASNIFFHTDKGGKIVVRPLIETGRTGVEIIAEDDGPGIPDVKLAMTDGYSTTGGLGSGLPGVRRLMDEFEICSKPGEGTRITARKWKSHADCNHKKSI